MEINGVHYGKPNMAALEGEWGRRIFDHIAATPRVDRERLDRECERLERRIREAQANGTY